jgi:hypothetical protein
LPSIGWEVELPKNPYKNQTYAQDLQLSENYQIFFNIVGLPWNKDNTIIQSEIIRDINKSSGGRNMLIEISTNPSASAQVQARILSELIKGNFIPSLYVSDDPKDIQIKLDKEQLVAFHFSVAIPKDRTNEIKERRKELIMLEDVLALGFTSYERLSSGVVTNWYLDNKKAVSMNSSDSIYRYEARMHEIRSSSIYRLLVEGQLLLFAIFAKNPHNTLSQNWLELYNFMKSKYEQRGIPMRQKERKEAVIELAKDKNLVDDIRKKITKCCQIL